MYQKISALLEENAERFWFVLFLCFFVFFLALAFFFTPFFQRMANATTWVITEDIFTTSDVGRAMNIAENSSSLPSVVFYDKTNKTIKYAQRETSGTWTVESVETLGGDYNFGEIQNIEFGIAKDPTDNKMSVAYLNYAYGGSEATSQVRYAHRAGDGSGNCGTSNNWTCSSIGSSSASYPRAIALAFHTTSSQPVALWHSTNQMFLAEYNGSSWGVTTLSGSPYSWQMSYDWMKAAFSFTTSTNQPIIFYSNANDLTGQEDGVNDGLPRFHYMVRGNDWTWTKTKIDQTTSDTSYRDISVVRDSSGYFYFAYGTNTLGLKYGTLKGTTLTTAVIDNTITPTWNSIALNSSGNPGIAYYDETNANLKLASYDGASWSLETVSSTNNVGNYASFYYYGTSPVIAYQDTTNANASFISATAFNSAPTAPTTPYTSTSTAQNGDTNPTNMATATPVFSALFQDGDTGNTGSKAQLQVTTSTNGFATITHWDSGSSGTSISSVAINARSQNIFYNTFGTAPTKQIGLADDGTEGGANTTYYWRIRFWDNSSLVGAWSATSTFSILDLPATPTLPYATFTATTSTVTWTDNSSIEDLYQLQVSTDNVIYSHAASTTAASLTTTSTTGLTPNTLYYYKVRGYNTAGYSALSTATSSYSLANIPTSLAASSSLYSVAHLTWNANSNPTGTEYYVSNVTASTVSGWFASTTYSFTGLEGAKTYSFQVKARNVLSTETSYTSVVSTTTLPNTPSNVSVTQGGTNAAISWSANGNSAGALYVVENVTLGTSSTPSVTVGYTWPGLTDGTRYTFRVVAKNSDNIYSAYSDSVTSAPGGSSGAAVAEAAREQQIRQQNQPSGTFALSSASGNTELTSSTIVHIALQYSANTKDMMISNDPAFGSGVWQPVSKKFRWQLVGGEGSRTVYIKLRSTTDFSSDVLAKSITLDKTPPQKPLITYPKNRTVYDDEQPEFFGGAEPLVGLRFELIREQTPGVFFETTLTARDTGRWVYEPAFKLPAGVYAFRLYARDEINNESEPTEVLFQINDTKPPPAAEVTYPPHNGKVTTSIVTTTGTSEPFAKIIFYRDGIITYQTTADAGGSWSYTIPSVLENGLHTIEYSVIDGANNQSEIKVITFEVFAASVEVDDETPPPPRRKKVVKKVDEPKPDVPVVPVKKTPRVVVVPKKVTEEKKDDGGGTVLPIGVGGGTSIPPAGGGEAGVGSGGSSGETNGSGGIGGTGGGSDETNSDSGGGVGGWLAEAQTGIEAVQAQLETLMADAQEKLGLAGAVLGVAAEKTAVVAKKAAKQVAASAKYARAVADKPEVQVANQAVAVPVTAVAAAGAVGGAVNAGQMSLYVRFLFTQPLFLLMRKRRKGWGMAYNAITKMPADLALVRLVAEADGRVVQSRVTDRDGRYQFFASPGTYKIEVSKPAFQFPPAYMVGKTEDGSLADLYTGGPVPLSAAAQISYNLPLDPGGEQKTNTEILRAAVKNKVAAVAGTAGLALTAVSFVISPTWLVGGFLVAHVGSFFVFRRLARPPKPETWGTVRDSSTGTALEKVVVRVFDTQYNKLLETQVTDSEGRYSFLVGSNQYYLMVEKTGYASLTTDPIKIEAPEGGAALARDVSLQPGTAPAAPPVAAPEPVPVPPPAPVPPVLEPAAPPVVVTKPLEEPVGFGEPATAPVGVPGAVPVRTKVPERMIQPAYIYSRPLEKPKPSVSGGNKVL